MQGDGRVGRGLAKRRAGIEAFVLDYLEEGFGKERIVAKLQKRFLLDEKKAEDFFIKYAPGLPDGK